MRNNHIMTIQAIRNNYHIARSSIKYIKNMEKKKKIEYIQRAIIEYRLSKQLVQIHSNNRLQTNQITDDL